MLLGRGCGQSRSASAQAKLHSQSPRHEERKDRQMYKAVSEASVVLKFKRMSAG